MKISKMPLRYP